MWYLIFLPILAALFWYYMIRPLSYWERKGVPQSRPWLIFGDNWFMFLRQMNFYDYVEWVYKMYPNKRYSGFYQFLQPTLVIKDPELIKQLTIKDFEHFTDHLGFVDATIDPLWGGNLFALKGNAWKMMRATLSGSFTSSKMKYMFHLMSEAGENFTKYFDLKNEDVIELEMKDAFSRFTNDVIATTAFGIKVDSLREPDNEFYAMGKEATNFSSLSKTLKFTCMFLAPKIAKILKIKIFDKKTGDFFNDVVKQTIDNRESQGIVRPDMINILLEARKGVIKQDDEKVDVDAGFATVEESEIGTKGKSKMNITNQDITAQALIFFFAGFDAVSTVMCFAAYELAIHQDIQDKVREEVNKTLIECEGKITYEALLKMKYFDMFISEVLRYWAPGLAADRVCVKPYTIQPVRADESPVHLDVGDTLWIPFYGLQRDPQYFPEPDKFIPERFSDENKHKINPYTFVPFGVGPRNCIGSRFALLETKAVIFHLLSKYRVVPTQKTQIPLQLKKGVFQIIAEKGFWFGLERIKP